MDSIQRPKDNEQITTTGLPKPRFFEKIRTESKREFMVTFGISCTRGGLGGLGLMSSRVQWGTQCYFFSQGAQV